MSDGKRYYWIKLKNDFFDLPTIDFLQDQKNGCEYIVLYQKLCLLAANSDGQLVRQVGEMVIPYDAKKISELARFKYDTVIVALELYKKIGLIIEQESGILSIPAVKEMIGSESKWAEKKRKHESQKLPQLSGTSCRRVNRETILLPSGKTQYIDETRYGGNGAVAFDKAKCKCQRCGTGENLLIHHNNGASNSLSDLVVLCTECHGIIHSAQYGGVFSGEYSGAISGEHSGNTGGDFPPQNTLNGIPSGGSFPPPYPPEHPPDNQQETPHKRLEYRDKSIENNKAAAAGSARTRECNSHAKIIDLFQDSIHPIANMVECDRLNELASEYGDEWLGQAIKEAGLNRAGSVRYIEAILGRWKSSGSHEPWKERRESGQQKPKHDRNPQPNQSESDGSIDWGKYDNTYQDANEPAGSV